MVEYLRKRLLVSHTNLASLTKKARKSRQNIGIWEDKLSYLQKYCTDLFNGANDEGARDTTNTTSSHKLSNRQITGS
mgnify:CR=1 FL=1